LETSPDISTLEEGLQPAAPRAGQGLRFSPSSDRVSSLLITAWAAEEILTA